METAISRSATKAATEFTVDSAKIFVEEYLQQAEIPYVELRAKTLYHVDKGDMTKQYVIKIITKTFHPLLSKLENLADELGILLEITLLKGG